jgi:uncharacterized protein
MDSIFVDTSAFYAVLDKSDKNHIKAVNFLKKNVFPLVTNNLVVIETVNLANARRGHEDAVKIGKKFYDEDIVTIINIVSEDEKKAWQIFKKYVDKKFSLTDCISFAIMDRLKIKQAFAFDIHFSQYGKFSVIPS